MNQTALGQRDFVRPGTSVVLVRHGETAWNLQGRLQGLADIPLSENGLRQAGAVGARLVSYNPAIVYSSPLQRAASTAEAIACACGVRLRFDERWREMDVGRASGLTRYEMEKQFPDFCRRRMTDPIGTAWPGGESVEDLYTRVWAALCDAVSRHPERTIVVVSHGGPITSCLASALGLPLREKWRLSVDNCALSMLAATETGWALRYLNR